MYSKRVKLVDFSAVYIKIAHHINEKGDGQWVGHVDTLGNVNKQLTWIIFLHVNHADLYHCRCRVIEFMVDWL